MSKKVPAGRFASFLSQKGGVGKSALARLLALAAVSQGLTVLLADLDEGQRTSLEWNSTRLRRGLQPELDVRPFKSLKKLRKVEGYFDLIIADAHGLADDLTRDVADLSDVIFLPTGLSEDDLKPTLGLARKLAKHDAGEKITLTLSKVSRSERRLGAARDRIRRAGFQVLDSPWTARDGFQVEFDAGRAGLDARSESLRQTAREVSAALLARVFVTSLGDRQRGGATER